MAVLMAIGARVRTSIDLSLNLEEGEFVLSEMEYEKFGLSKGQRGQIYRTIMDLIRFEVVQKTGKRTENAQAAVYRILPNDFIDCSRKRESDIENKQRTNRERTENEQRDTKNVRVKECEIDKNVLSKLTVQKPVFDFDEIWEIWPRKEAKQAAFKKLARVCKTREDYDNMVIAVKNYTAKVCNTEKKYIKKLNNWLEDWRDYIVITDTEKLDALVAVGALSKAERIAQESMADTSW